MTLDELAQECFSLFLENTYEISENGLTLKVVMHMDQPKFNPSVRHMKLTGDFKNNVLKDIFEKIELNNNYDKRFQDKVLHESGFADKVGHFKMKLAEAVYDSGKNYEQIRYLVLNKAVVLYQQHLCPVKEELCGRRI